MFSHFGRQKINIRILVLLRIGLLYSNCSLSLLILCLKLIDAGDCWGKDRKNYCWGMDCLE